MDKSEPSHLSSILNLLCRRLFDVIQRPQKDIKEKGCWVLWGLVLWQLEIEERVVTDHQRAVTWHRLHVYISLCLKCHCKTVQLGQSCHVKFQAWFGSKSAWTRHDATFQCTTAILGRSVNCVRMTWLLDIFLVAGWKCHSCLHSFEFLHDLFKTVQGQFHSTARSLQHSSIGRCRTGIRLLVVRLLHWAIPFFSSTTSAFWLAFIGLAPSDRT